MKLSLYFENITEKQRLMMIATVGVMLIIITLYITTPKATDAISIPKKNAIQVDNISNKAIMHKEYPIYQDEQTTRDPFALDLGSDIPKGQIEPTLTNPPRHVATEMPIPSKQQEKRQSLPILTGLASNADKQIAIIQSANKSKAYQLNEYIGEYQLRAINEDNVILTGIHGQVVLQLQSSRENGGNSSEK